MSGVAGKIVRHVIAKINVMLAAQADKREHELADQDRAADDGTGRKKTPIARLFRKRLYQ